MKGFFRKFGEGAGQPENKSLPEKIRERLFKEKPLSQKLEKLSAQIAESVGNLSEELRKATWGSIKATYAESMKKSNPLADLADMGYPGASKIIDAEANLLRALAETEEAVKKLSDKNPKYILAGQLWQETKAANAGLPLENLPQVYSAFVEKIKELETF